MKTLLDKLMNIPEIKVLETVEQDKIFHPEGNVLIHTKMVIEALPKNSEEHLIWAAALHDVGKLKTQNIISEDRITFYGHEVVSSKIAEIVLKREGRLDLINKVIPLVRHHMRPHSAHKFGKKGMGKTLNMPFLDDLIILAKADTIGRGIDNPSFEGINAILKAIYNRNKNHNMGG